MKQSTRLVDVLIKRPPSDLPHSFTDPDVDEGTEHFFYSWELDRRAEPETHTSSLQLRAQNSDIHEFRRNVASLGKEIFAVLVEEGEENERHITTFVNKLTEELARQIYALEAEIIQKYRNRIFDFHVREAPRDDSGEVQLPGGTYYLLTWQA